LKWILDRCDGQGDALETPIGATPNLDAIDRTGLTLDDNVMGNLLKVDAKEWAETIAGQIKGRVPKGMLDEQQELAQRIHKAAD
jgi:phosphoenolpyruvate carboxykinase (GTP)